MDNVIFHWYLHCHVVTTEDIFTHKDTLAENRWLAITVSDATERKGCGGFVRASGGNRGAGSSNVMI